ncbi:hypothetical protein AHAS_Ahas16G0304000 [Arachis hypogaea]
MRKRANGRWRTERSEVAGWDEGENADEGHREEGFREEHWSRKGFREEHWSRVRKLQCAVLYASVVCANWDSGKRRN